MDRRLRHTDRGGHQDVHRGHVGWEQTVYDQIRFENRTENGTPQHFDMVSGAQLGRWQKVTDENPFERQIRSEG